MAESNSQPTRCPCGFFGSAQTLGLCSKCFREREESLDHHQILSPIDPLIRSSSNANIIIPQINMSSSTSAFPTTTSSPSPPSDETCLNGLNSPFPIMSKSPPQSSSLPPQSSLLSSLNVTSSLSLTPPLTTAFPSTKNPLFKIVSPTTKNDLTSQSSNKKEEKMSPLQFSPPMSPPSPKITTHLSNTNVKSTITASSSTPPLPAPSAETTKLKIAETNGCEISSSPSMPQMENNKSNNVITSSTMSTPNLPSSSPLRYRDESNTQFSKINTPSPTSMPFLNGDAPASNAKDDQGMIRVASVDSIMSKGLKRKFDSFDEESSSSSSSASLSELGQQKNKKRCYECRCKLDLALQAIGKCKCDYIFCPLHRLPEQHNCTFNHKEVSREEARAKMVVFKKHVGTALKRLDSDS